MTPQDAKYLGILLNPVAKCIDYKPKFGKGKKAATAADFRSLYGDDLLYHWVGLDSTEMYAAHKAAGGMTSVYRQLGIGCERLFRHALMDSFGLTKENLEWSFEYERAKGKIGKRSLDARVLLEDIEDLIARERLRAWLNRAARHLKLSDRKARELRGAVFEVRQGYKSADSKRQTADLIFGSNASDRDFLPVVAVVSRQVSEAVVKRYESNTMLVLLGTVSDNDVESTYSFCKNVVGYDLAGFFERNTTHIRTKITSIVSGLMRSVE